ncbi:rhodanese-like domain-containing protein [Perlabentimonas gracilis]|uniref:rhodanese-like domain-containing protein n=1 Tax=Perlabentimonas gracilis TaxID=2715279 RepID=UPI00140A00FF|nr:rhodanese-like domain-containing protein [Perlabentimonas gracilis]NHB68982.1 rhodanese-like domain-containing protein [Perlabentimonas gracilis]
MDVRKITYFIVVAGLLSACGGGVEQKSYTALAPEVAFDSLITYIERSGDFINSPQVPAMISAGELYAKLDSNVLVIDMRSAEEFASAHIANSVNVPFTQVLNFFENKINPSCFSAIAMVCNAGQTASYATSILRFLGYDNVYALKWGFSSWHNDTAQKRWMARRSSKYSEVLQREANRKNPAGEFPKIVTSESYGFAILRERAHMLFAEDFSPITITADTLFEAGQNFYIANYWPEPLYNIGHIPGAIQYQPKKSLKRSEQLNTLPTDKSIVVYCFTGQHSAFVTAYLRLLGYDALTLVYGANSFMHSVMVKENTGNAFTEKEIYGLPVSSGSGAPQNLEKVEVVAVPRGGC